MNRIRFLLITFALALFSCADTDTSRPFYTSVLSSAALDRAQLVSASPSWCHGILASANRVNAVFHIKEEGYVGLAKFNEYLNMNQVVEGDKVSWVNELKRYALRCLDGGVAFESGHWLLPLRQSQTTWTSYPLYPFIRTEVVCAFAEPESASVACTGKLENGMTIDLRRTLLAPGVFYEQIALDGGSRAYETLVYPSSR